MREKLECAGGIAILLLGIASLWLVPATVVFATRYPWSTEDELLSNLRYFYFLQLSPELEEKRKEIETYEVTVTLTVKLEVQAFDKEAAIERALKHRSSILSSYKYRRRIVTVDAEEQQ